MRLFGRSKDVAVYPQNGDTETVRAKLAACEREVQSAEADLRAISLEAALSDSPDAGNDAIARLNALRSKRELLVNALAAAEQAEAEREAAVHAREWQARKRSLAQKAGQLERDAVEVARATEALNNAKQRMKETGAAIIPLLPRSLQNDAKPFHHLLSHVVLDQLALLEAWRLDPRGSKKPDRLANHMPGFMDHRTGVVRSITDIVGELCTNLKTQFEACGLSAKLPQPTPAPQQPTPEINGIVVDLRGVDLGVPKVTEEPANEDDQVQTEGVTANE
jgi:hypothetical protein